MNKLKWYDFVGALILLFSVTKSAIKPPVLTGYVPQTPSIPTTFPVDFQKIAPREAALSQIDMLNPSMIGNLVPPEVQVEMVNMVHGDIAYAANIKSVKAIPKSAPRVEAHHDEKGKNSVGLRSHTSARAPTFIY